MTGLKIIELDSVPTAVIDGVWHDDYASAMRRQSVNALELNYAKGWRRSDLDFLAKLQFLRHLTLIDRNLNDDAAVGLLLQLQTLKLHTSSKKRIDLSGFRELFKFSSDWRRGFEGVFESRTLRELYLHAYTGADLNAVNSITSLENLSLTHARSSKFLTEDNHTIVSVRLGRFRHLTSPHSIRHFCAAQRIVLQDTVNDWDLSWFSGLSRLVSLVIDNCGAVKNARALEAGQLEELFVTDVAMTDEEEQVLLRLKGQIAKVVIGRRR